jgi:hypothetical protein
MTPDRKDALIQLLERLPPADLVTVTRFAEFLLQRPADAPAAVPAAGVEMPAPADIPEPETIERPAGEKVVAAVRRLSKSYYMLDKKQMLGVTSDLVTQHLLQGRDAVEVIDELELLFAQHYRKLKGEPE